MMKKENVIDNSFDFCMEFLRLENNQKNKVYSPLSIFYALKMLSEGAKGRTKEQVDCVIKNLDLITYSNIDSVFSSANAIFIQNNYAECVRDDYKNRLMGDYAASVIYDSFQSAKHINDWISKETFGIIPNMLSDDMIDSEETKMLLVNALALDMEWVVSFDYTRSGEFYLSDGTSMKATTMHRECVSYYKDDAVTAVRLGLKEYENMKLEFVAIMPEKRDLSDYIMNFSKDDFDNIIENIKYSVSFTSANLNIPKFSFEYNLNFKNDLMRLGITDAFNRELANLSNMCDVKRASDNLFFSDAYHKAKIDFTEAGIKAAAVTVFVAIDTGFAEEKKPPIIININKPFLYFIRDSFTGQILFVGTVYRPNSWADDEASYRNQKYYF